MTKCSPLSLPGGSSIDCASEEEKRKKTDDASLHLRAVGRGLRTLGRNSCWPSKRNKTCNSTERERESPERSIILASIFISFSLSLVFPSFFFFLFRLSVRRPLGNLLGWAHVHSISLELNWLSLSFSLSFITTSSSSYLSYTLRYSHRLPS